MDPVTIALGLASVIPSAVRWLAGDNAGDVADTVITTAKRITGIEDGAAAATAIHASPELQAQLQREWKAHELALYQAEVDDRKDARNMRITTGSRATDIIACIVILGYFAVLAYMVRFGIPKDAAGSEAMLILLGALSTAFGTVLAFYFGSSKGSQAKDATIHRMGMR